MASESGRGAKPHACQAVRRCVCGVVGPARKTLTGLRVLVVVSRTVVGWLAGEGESPVDENYASTFGAVSPSSSGLVESAVNRPGPPGKPEYSLMTDSARVP